MVSLNDQVDTLELINKEVSERLARLSTAGTQTDTKAALVGGVAAKATQFLASRQDPQPVLTTLAFIALSLAFLTAVAAYAVVRHHDVPDPRDLVIGFAHRSKSDTLASLVATRVDVFGINHRKHRRKVVLWWCSVFFLSAGLALSAAAIVQTVPRDRTCLQPGPVACLSADTSSGAGAHADG